MLQWMMPHTHVDMDSNELDSVRKRRRIRRHEVGREIRANKELKRA